ncbi:MAG: 2-phospho-L-lactate transferase [Magnetovibrionaceae bacterium]
MTDGSSEPCPRVVALCGGVGGAKLALGLSKVVGPEDLTIIANTGDDFEHLGLAISPDLDTVLYTLAGLANPQQGWGRADETWSFMESLDTLGGETWFKLGDKDLALHVERTRRLGRGETLSTVTDRLRRNLGVGARLLPMSDQPVRTMVQTDRGELAFQNYFVAMACEPVVTGFRFDGIETASPAPGVLEAINAPGLDAIIICPSNPFVSVNPMLSLPGFREALAAAKAPIVAVSPIVGGKALKGPAAKMMAELGQEISPATVVEAYQDFLDGFVLDQLDRHSTGALPCPVRFSQTVMSSLDDRMSLARDVLAFAISLKQDRSPAADPVRKTGTTDV